MKFHRQINTIVAQFVMAIEAKHLSPDERLVTQKLESYARQVARTRMYTLMAWTIINPAMLWALRDELR